MKTAASVLSLIGFIAFSAIPVAGQTPVRINWTAVTGAQSGMFMAQQEGLFKKKRSRSRVDSHSFQLQSHPSDPGW
jgi:ABC-type nitrate/sulfonate/bicarbonate transport system substrate-binding protein